MKPLILYLAIVFVFLSIVDCQTPWDPLQQFPVAHGWPAHEWNHKFLEWGYEHLELLKTSAYRSSNSTTASFYIRAFASSARTVTVLADCIYDAWVAASGSHDEPVSGSRINTHYRKLTGPKIVEAISYASYTAHTYNFGFLGSSFQQRINNTLVSQGYNLNNVNYNRTDTAYGLGVLACQKVIALAKVDGSNSEGNNPFGVPVGERLSDYTNYRPPQDAMPFLGKTDCDSLKYIDSWQPALSRVAVNTNNTIIRAWFDRVIGNAKPFAMPCTNSFRPGPVPKNISTTYNQWMDRNIKVVNRSYELGDYEKAFSNLYQYAEGYTGIGWTKFAILAAQKGNLTLERAIKLFFFHSHAQYESYIVQFEGKRFYNAPRPISPIQCIFRNQQINAWKGPYQGVGTINGSNWSAYLPDTLVMNQTPEYPCGHCVMSGATHVAMRYFFKSNAFIGEGVTYLPGTFIQEPKLTPGTFGYRSGVTDVPNSGRATVGYAPANNVTLNWSTWYEVTKQASMSRIYLGVHYPDSEEISFDVGEKLGAYVARFINRKYFKIHPQDDDEDFSFGAN